MDNHDHTFTHSQKSGGYLLPYLDLVRNTVIPYQWDALNDQVAGAEPSRAIRNFRIAAGLESGGFHGYVFQDSDVGKWIEAVAWSLRNKPDPDLERKVDETVEIMALAQAPDGYLNTWFTIKEPGKRWTNLCECHELYSAGHLLEGAVTYFQATGKRRFLDIMLRYVDLIERTFGTGQGQIRGYDGHEEIELALLRLHEVTGDRRHLDLAAYFLEERGQQPAFFDQEWEARGRISHWTGQVSGKPGLAYHQSHLPIRQQTHAVGHAVRAVYLYTAMADLANKMGDQSLRDACEVLWRNICDRQRYVTGGIGSTHSGEAFTFDWDLPNDTVYSETCASIGLAFFARKMLEGTPRTEYADVIEQALYNTILAGMSLDGRHFFYVNPLEVWPEASALNPDRQHVKARRQPWFGCACCPPNLARFLMSFDDQVFMVRGNTVYLSHYLPGRLEVRLDGGSMDIEMTTAYPQAGRVSLKVVGVQSMPAAKGSAEPKQGSTGTDALSATLALRIPGWCGNFSVQRNSVSLDAKAGSDGYLALQGEWKPGDEVELVLAMEVQVIEAHPEARADAGKVCLRRGPLVYCLEETDNGQNLSRLSLDPESSFEVLAAPGLPEGTLMIQARGKARRTEGWEGRLYRPRTTGDPGAILSGHQGLDGGEVLLKAVPYHLWGNRGEGEMTVWFRA